uniref:Uncharacterized protein n=1 Tax=Anthurium amnicola TaxID=1678845 RepID=A0A1D1ZHV5_9ARAE
MSLSKRCPGNRHLIHFAQKKEREENRERPGAEQEQLPRLPLPLLLAFPSPRHVPDLVPPAAPPHPKAPPFPILPWLPLSPPLPHQTQLASSPPGPLSPPPHRQGHEEHAGAGRLRHQRQDGGGGGGEAGPPPQVQEAGPEEEDVPGARPRQPVQGRGLSPAREVPPHQQEQGLRRPPCRAQERPQAGGGRTPGPRPPTRVPGAVAASPGLPSPFSSSWLEIYKPVFIMNIVTGRLLLLCSVLELFNRAANES